MDANQVQASQVATAVQGTSSDRTSLTDEICTLVADQVASSIQNTLPRLLQEAFAAAAPPQLPNPAQALVNEGEPQPETSQLNSRLAKYYIETKETVLSEEIATFLSTAFTKRLSKDVWSDLMKKYPPIKGMEEVLVAPTMETGDGLVEKQAPFLAVARPIAAALDLLEGPLSPDKSEGPDPDEIKAYLEDALVLLGNANFRLNAWRQKRFGEFLTDTNSKVIAAPSKPQFRKATSTQPFRAFSGPSAGTSGPRSWGKRKWSYKSPGNQKADFSSFSSRKKPSLSDQGLPMSPATPTTAYYMIPRLNMITLPEQQTAGRLKHFIENWKIITSDGSVLETVRGYRIPLISKPHQWRERVTKARSLEQQLLLSQAISDLVSKGGSTSGCGTGGPVPFNLVHSTAGEQEPTSFQPEDIEQICPHRKVQTRKFGPRSNRVTDNLQDCNHPTHRPRFYHQTREVLTITNASNHLSGGPAELDGHDNSCSSGETLPHTVGVQRDPDQGVLLHAGTFSIAGSNESDCPNWNLGSTLALSSPSTDVHCGYTQERSLHTIKTVPDSSNERSILRTQVVVFGATKSSQPDGVEPSRNRHDNIDRRLQESISGIRDMELLHISGDMDYSETCSWGDEHRSRFCIKELQQQNGMDSEQESIPNDNQEVLHPRGGSICMSNQQPRYPGSVATDAFLQHWGQWTVFIHTPIGALAMDFAEITTGPSNGTGDSPNLARTAMVPSPPGATSGFSSSVTNSRGNNLRTIRTTSNTSNVENPPTSCMAAVRSHLQTTGLSPEKVDSCEFIIHTHVKNSRPYHPPRKIFLGRYQQDCSICVVRCLEHYLQRTSNHRRYKELLLSYVNPYRPVGSQTISRSICTLIRLAGVDVCYTGHSTRAGSTSEVVDNGVPLEVVLEAADWSSAQTFEKHYHKRADKARFAHKYYKYQSEKVRRRNKISPEGKTSAGRRSAPVLLLSVSEGPRRTTSPLQKLKLQIQINDDISGYIFEHALTPLASGGAGMFIDETLNYHVLERFSNEAFQAVWIQISFEKEKNIICGIIYRQHKSPEHF
ncbi:Gag-Pol poly [Paramuricea clavata]|uniref:Gag-Pol poly n=1 Tax=Paramuricea clavata TaxID=317549 RepID=A0A6S7J1F1_PARCT|nr:Gag-Pol poly [Paramuricea clavata]